MIPVPAQTKVWLFVAAILTFGLIVVLARSRKLVIEMARAAAKRLRSGAD